MNRQRRISSDSKGRSLRLELLERRLPLSVNVSGEVFWDANRNGVDDDSIAAPSGVTISLNGNQGAPGANIQNMPLVGTEVPYTINGIVDESVDPTTGASFEVADIDSQLASNFELTSPLANEELSLRSYSTRSNNQISKPSWIETADLDGINGPDLIVANYQGSKLTIFLNDGAGVFTTRHQVDVAANSTSIVTADFDDDGDVDIVVGNLNSLFFELLVNDGSGTFATPGAVVPIASGNGPSSIVATDVNRDGKADLVVSNFWDHSVSVYLNESSGGQIQFDTTGNIDDVGTTVGSTMIAAVQLGGPAGAPSLAVLDIALSQVLIFDNDGQGNFTFSGNTIDVEGSRFITAGRVDDDSFDDLAVHDPSKREVRVYFGNAQGGFDSTFADPMTVWFPRGIALADMDGDGDNDLVANLIDARPPTILRNDGDRRIADAMPIENVPLDAVVTSPPAMADFNGDGVVDIAYSPEWFGGSIRVSLRRLNEGPQIVRTVNESGQNHSLVGRDFGVARVVSAESTATGDFDGDGIVDGLDLEVWRANYGTTAGPGMSADANTSLAVDGGDFLAWQRNFSALAATSTVANPTDTPAAGVSRQSTSTTLDASTLLALQDSTSSQWAGERMLSTLAVDEVFHESATLHPSEHNLLMDTDDQQEGSEALARTWAPSDQSTPETLEQEAKWFAESANLAE